MLETFGIYTDPSFTYFIKDEPVKDGGGKRWDTILFNCNGNFICELTKDEKEKVKELFIDFGLKCIESSENCYLLPDEEVDRFYTYLIKHGLKATEQYRLEVWSEEIMLYPKK